MNKIKEAVLSSMEKHTAGEEPEAVSRRFAFASEFIGFSGHFPGFPVLPAFVQILAAQAAIESNLARPLRLHGINNAKFLATVEPGQVLETRCARNKAGDNHRWTAVLSVDGKKVASFQMIFMDDDIK